MKVCGYVMLHYGSEYLDATIKSIEPVCEKIFVVYSKNPSHSHGTTMECPDKEEDLKRIAKNASDKVLWFSYDRFAYEGEHRGECLKLAKAHGFQMAITVDSDEVWEPNDLQKAIDDAWAMDCTHVQIDGFLHFWKDFNHVCRDWFHPVRIIKLNDNIVKQGVIRSTIYHFGYAQNEETMRYKLDIHGHKAELRTNWIDKWINWKEGETDLHPVAIGLWNAEPFDKTTLPELLKNHPNYNL